MTRRLFFGIFFFLLRNFLFGQNLASLADSVKSGFRGLSVVDENVVWMSGKKGLVGVLQNASGTCSTWKWIWNRVAGFENSDFRSIYAFDKDAAVIANAGFPASILFTSNGGKSWTKSFSSNDSAMFFDGIDFWDKRHGIIFGDPVRGRMYLSETFDGGKTWKEIPFDQCPQLENGEAGFAASGTTIRVGPNGNVWIATGGTVSRVWHSRDYGHHWEVFNTPILQGKSSQGIFSIAFYDTLNGIIVGGDYSVDTLKKNNCFLTHDGGKTWVAPRSSTYGYRSCVEYITKDYLIAVGTGGNDVSMEDGETWNRDSGNFNTIKYLPGSKYYFACGGKSGFGFAKFSIESSEKKKKDWIH